MAMGDEEMMEEMMEEEMMESPDSFADATGFDLD